MKVRKSFLIRWLTTKHGAEAERSVIDVEHIQSGDRTCVSTIEEAGEWMQQRQISKTSAGIINSEKEIF